MGVTQEKKVVARCDADKCNAVRYGTDDIPPAGYHIVVERVFDANEGVTGEKMELFVCSPAHASAALKDRLGGGMGQQIEYPIGDLRDPAEKA